VERKRRGAGTLSGSPEAVAGCEKEEKRGERRRKSALFLCGERGKKKGMRIASTVRTKKNHARNKERRKETGQTLSILLREERRRRLF